MIQQYWKQLIEVIQKISRKEVNALIDELFRLRDRNGRLFVIGVGGGAGNASHAVNDFRKFCDIEAYAPMDNVSELTARINDDGWNNAFWGCLAASKINSRDAVLVFSVGGGNYEKKISTNIIEAIKNAKKIGAKVFGIVGRDGGYTKKIADVCVLIPTVNPLLVTPIVESMQAIIWHTIVFHPTLQVNQGKWESIKK